MIGERIPLRDGVAKVTGTANFLEDLKLPNMLHGKILRSPFGHAKIISIDTEEAKKLPGVVAVLTGKDVGPSGPLVAFPYSQTLETPDEFVLAREKVRYQGDEVAVVAAETEDIAEDALDHIKINYEPLPVVTDPGAAMEPGAPVLHEGLEGVDGNIHFQRKFRAGDAEKGLLQADVVLKQRFVTSKPSATPMEVHSSIASYDSSSGRLTLWTPTQLLHVLRGLLADVLGMPRSKVRVISPYVGGSFGCKAQLFSHEICTALLSIKTGRPVRIVLTRKEDFMTTPSRHPQIMDVEIGLKNDGTITAWKEKVVIDSGAYASYATHVAKQGATMRIGPYKLPNMWIDIYVVYTNKVPGGAYRGFGNVQGTYARELMFDIAAKKLGMDPYEFREKNIVNPEDLPFTTCNGLILRSCKIKEAMEKTAVAVNYKKLKQEKKPYRGVGIANMLHWSSIRSFADSDFSSALVKFEDDGSVTVSTDACDQGQGHTTIFSQIVAQELGVSFDKITMINQDTDTAPYGFGTFGSRTTVMAGTALTLAAREARKKLFKIAAHLLEASPEDLVAHDNKVFVAGSPDKSITLQEVVKAAYFARAALPEDVKIGTITGSASFDSPTVTWNEKGVGNISVNYPNATHAAVVEIDPETGKVEIIDYAISQDVGKAINPLMIEGQFGGGFAQGLGYALYEDLLYDKAGILRNPSFRDYKIPTIADVPMINKIYMLETENLAVSHNQKGIGETALNPVAPAIANAIYDAIGVPITELPITAEKILKAIKSKPHIASTICAKSLSTRFPVEKKT